MEWIAGDEGEISARRRAKNLDIRRLYDLSSCDCVLKRPIRGYETNQIIAMNLLERAKERVTMGCDTHVS
jgi:hypothetical protein